MSRIAASLVGAWSTQVAFGCDCSTQQAIDRLRANPGSESWISPVPGLAGRLDPDSLWLWLAPRGRNSFHAFFRGRLTRSGAMASRLEGEIRLHRAAIGLMAFILIALIVFLAAALDHLVAAVRAGDLTNADLLLVALSAGFFATVLLVVSRGIQSFVRSRDDLVSFLTQTLGVTEPPKSGE
jgi:hypothetical protein